MALVAAPASATKIHPFAEAFGSAAQPSFGSPLDIAVDPSSGDVLVMDAGGTPSIKRYNADGTADNFSALGSNAIDGARAGASNECPTVPSDCDQTPENGLGFGGPNVSQIAIDDSGTATDGDIYVTQGFPNLINVFSEEGEYLGQLTAAGANPFSEACGVAVDPAGAVYVGDYFGGIHKFVPAANPPVNADHTATFTSTSAPCALAAGAGPSAGFLFPATAYFGEISKIDSATGELKYTATSGPNTTVGVDPGSGHVYAAREQALEEWDASGSGSATLVSGTAIPSSIRGLAVDGTSGDIYLTREGAANVEVYGGTTVSIPTVTIQPASGITATTAVLNGTINPEGEALTECKFEYALASSPTYTDTAACAESVPGDSNDHSVSAKVEGLAADGSEYRYRLVAANANGTNDSSSQTFTTKNGVEATPASGVTASGATLNGVVRPEGQALADCFFEYGTDASFGDSVPCTPSAGSIPADFGDHAVSANVSGLDEATAYYFRLVTTDSGGTAQATAQAFETLGKPVISHPAAVVRLKAATIGAFVNPAGSDTTYHFEWGTTTAYGNTAPAGLEPSVGSGTDPVPVEAKLSDLEIGQTYHFRIVATNSQGTTEGPDYEFSTYSPLGLPDGRAYEQVSPVDKNNTDILTNGAVAARDGNGLIFRSPLAFPGSPGHFFLVGDEYLARRGGSGWSTTSLNPPAGAFSLNSSWMAFTEDLSKGVVQWRDKGRDSIDPNAPSPGFNVYLRDNTTGSFSLLSGTLAEAGFGTSNVGGFGGGSSDFGKIGFSSELPLTPDAPPEICGGPDESYFCAYENDHGTLRLASIVDGQPVSGTVGGGRFSSVDHSVSGDGSRLFFSTQAGGGGGGEELYVREDGQSTTQISASERTLPGGAESGRIFYQDAEAAHGDRVLFTTARSLVDADTNSTNDLYMYDFNAPAGEHLTLVSEDRVPLAPDGAQVIAQYGFGEPSAGLVAASEDLKRVYFVAENQIVPDAPSASGPKLYLWEDAGAEPEITYVGSLTFADALAWRAPSVTTWEMREARASSDGRYLTLLSTSRLTPFDNEGAKEAYLYDAVEDSIACASCSSDAFPANGDIGFGGLPSASNVIAPWNHLLRNVSAGGEVFFETARGLLPKDSNGKVDVYAYRDNQLRLISRGTDDHNSTFLDASASGDDVFLATVDRLVGWDEDGSLDAYDARVGGGLPEPPPVTPGCQGEACQPPPVVPSDPTPGSSSFEGAGNVSQPRARGCGKGKVRRHGKCRKRKQARKQHRQSRPATRSHG